MEEQTGSSIERIVKTAEEEAGKPCSEFSKEEFLSLIFDRAYISYSFYCALRQHLFALLPKASAAYQIVHSIVYTSLNHTSVYQREFFASYQDMMNYAQNGVKETARNRSGDVRVFDTTLAALILAWCGIQITDSISVKKSDVCKDRPQILLPSGEWMNIPKNAHKFLLSYIETDGFYTCSHDRVWQQYIPSVFLLRTNRSIQLNPTAIRVAISRNIPVKEKLVTYDSVYWSGVFCRVHAYEQKHGKIVEPARRFGEERDAYIDLLLRLFGERDQARVMQLFTRVRQYRAYQRFFYPDDVAEQS